MGLDMKIFRNGVKNLNGSEAIPEDFLFYACLN